MSLDREKLVRILSILAVLAIFIFVVLMFIYPFAISNGDWNYVQEVWVRWQGLNVGMLAFVSSMVAFYISRYKAELQREREFLASKAFLPQAFSQLCSYFEKSAEVYRRAWVAGTEDSQRLNSPDLPEGYEEIFKDCIRHALPEVGDYLSVLLANLQIHHSRMSNIGEQIRDAHITGPNRPYILSCLCRLGELQALVDQMFEFARNTEKFRFTNLAYDDFETAFAVMHVRIEDFYLDDTRHLASEIDKYINTKAGISDK